MFRLWLSRRWFVATLVAILFALACFFLGRWQWSRHLEQRTKVAAIESNYDAAPVPLAAALEGPLTPARQWTRVRLTGTYAAQADLLARNRPLEKTLGFEVLTPFTTEEAATRTVLVDRGWIQSGGSAAATPDVQDPPEGTVEVTGWLRSGEVSLGRDLPPGQLGSINIVDARAQRPELADVDVYVVLGQQVPSSPATATTPRLLPRPDEGLGPHQAYAIQWWLTMPGGLVFVWWAMRRELTLAQEAGTPSRPKKVRIWDEEDA
ncbi:MAG TPA: SURF1 family protein [Dermatophilaceae bacterium]|nr:SURF1 family protein [Dermatophilaceae bacterium]